jgi:membrane protein
MKKRVLNFFSLMKTAGIESFSEDNIMKQAAALAYYTIFSIVPMLIIIIWVTSIFYEPGKVQGEVLFTINDLIGKDASRQIQEALINMKFDSKSGWAKALGIITLVLTATGIFVEVQDSINTIWGLKAKPKKGIIRMVLSRLISFSMVIALGFVLVVSLSINALISGLTGRIQAAMPHIPIFLFYIVDQVVIFIVITTLFSSIYKVLPDAKIKWRDVFGGAAISALLFMGGKFLIGYYLEGNATITAYGSAGSVIIILLWVYYSAIILYFGAEFTQAYLKLKGRHIEPNEYAEWIEIKEVPVDSNTELVKEE